MNLSYFFINKLLQIKNFFLFDISLNRVVTGKRFLRKNLEKKNFKKLNFFCSSLDKIPLMDNSVDLVFTNHAIEPNKNN